MGEGNRAMAQALESRLRPVSVPGARVPPHNLDAEESLLGAMLLNRDAVAQALECCRAEDFYKPAHGHIFSAITALYSRGEEVDVVTVTDELQRTGLLDAIGDPSVLLSLSANTPSPGNAGAYARIVEEHSLLRGLISVADEIAELGYSLPEDVSEVIDEAERKVFGVAERRVVESMSPLRELLSQTLDHLEHLYERGETITGVPTGYVDLDERLAGLQKSNLVVVGARPAMGKALALETPVATPSGWTTMGELEPGDEVFDEGGHPCRVTYTSPVFLDHRCYRVCFDDGSELVADAGHRWLVYDLPAWRAHRDRAASPASAIPGDPRRRAWRALPQVVTTEDLVRGGVRTDAGRPRWYVPLTAPLELPQTELPVDPYRLGLHLAESAIEGTPARVPDCYLRAAFKDRLELVSGLLDGAGDSRGLPGSRRPELHLPDRFLVEQAREVLCSLGLKPSAVRRHALSRSDGPSPTWSLSWDRRDGQPSAPTGRRLQAALALSAGGRQRRRAVVSVEEVPSIPVRCIAVDSPSRLFLAGRSMIPTHNTSFALGIVAHAAVHARIPVLLFSLEMSHLELSQRLLCSEARVDATRMRNGRLLEADWGKISEAIGRLGDAPIYIDDNPNVTVMDIRAKARRLKAREGLGLVVVDYLQLMSGHQRSRAENRQVEVSEISRGLKVLARELDIPVVALSQLSRNLEMRQDKRPVLADLRESGSIEQDSDVVMFIYRDELYNPESTQRGTAEIIVAKHRNGPTGTVSLAFMDHHTRFANMAKV
jgi:replicative DNA helicase